MWGSNGPRVPLKIKKIYLFSYMLCASVRSQLVLLTQACLMFVYLFFQKTQITCKQWELPPSAGRWWCLRRLLSLSPPWQKPLQNHLLGNHLPSGMRMMMESSWRWSIINNGGILSSQLFQVLSGKKTFEPLISPILSAGVMIHE